MSESGHTEKSVVFLFWINQVRQNDATLSSQKKLCRQTNNVIT